MITVLSKLAHHHTVIYRWRLSLELFKRHWNNDQIMNFGNYRLKGWLTFTTWVEFVNSRVQSQMSHTIYGPWWYIISSFFHCFCMSLFLFRKCFTAPLLTAVTRFSLLSTTRRCFPQSLDESTLEPRWYWVGSLDSIDWVAPSPYSLSRHSAPGSLGIADAICAR